jgi:hypothetical protein
MGIVKKYNLTPEEYSEIKKFADRMKANNLNEVDVAVLSKNQAIALNKVFGKGTAKVSLLTPIIGEDANGRKVEGYNIGDSAKLKSDYLKTTTKGGEKTKIKDDEINKLNEFSRNLNIEIGNDDDAPKKQTGGGSGGAKMTPTINNQQEFQVDFALNRIR